MKPRHGEKTKEVTEMENLAPAPLAPHEQYLDHVQVDYDLLVYTVGSYHYNWHHQIEIFWLLAGDVEVNVDGTRHVLHQNDLLAINSNCGHATFALASNCIALRLHLDPAFFTRQGLDLSHGQFELNSAALKLNVNYAPLRQALAQLALAPQQTTSAFERNALIYQVTALLWRGFFNAAAPTRHLPQRRQGSIENVMTYLNNAYAQDVTLETAAQIGNYSPSYLSRIFKEELGINFYEYLVRCRLQHAVLDLSETTDKIGDIALANGFKEIKSFNLMFKKHFGQTPSTYRQQLSPTVRGQNDHFKRALTPAQSREVHDRLTQVATAQRGNLVSPCESCVYRLHERDYQDLKAKVDQLKSVLNH